jgi:ribosomal protein L11 methyltransferase
VTHPTLTYELHVSFPGEAAAAVKTKERLIDWLLLNGVESFVEGALDVDYNHEYGEPERDFYGEFGGDNAPVSIYRYSRESLDDLRAKVEKAFEGKIAAEMKVMKTETWMEGWKESFRPFSTERFYVAPPWVKDPVPAGLIGIVIEPGMAFGTGQHATTRLCLDQLGKIVAAAGSGAAGKAALASRRVLDVGTGTGILAIGAKLVGYGPCLGTDIDDDAMLASAENARENHADVTLRKGSVPKGEAFDLVFANILAVVLLRIMDELAGVVAPGGRLVLSGILVEEEHELVASARRHGLTLVDTGRQDGWSCLVLTR